MRGSSNKLDQALKDLIEAFVQLDEEMTEKYEEDEEAYTSAMLETLETSIEGALEDQDMEPKAFANLLSFLSDSLEQLDPVAFEGEGSEEEEEDEDYEGDDDIDYDELDEDEGDDDDE